MKKVLIADDEPMIREGLAEMLMSFDLGLNIVGKAKNGVEALSMAKIQSRQSRHTNIRQYNVRPQSFGHTK